MRAWSNLSAFQEWKKGVKEITFPVTAENLDNTEACFKKAIEIESGRSFAEAAEKDEGFSRAWSRLGYCYMLRYIEGFVDELGNEADDYTARAVRMDPHNYDVHWDRAIFYQLTGELNSAEEEFQTARDLNDCNVDLIVEQSELYLNLGDHDHALELLCKAGEFVNHDWFQWSFAWTCYFKAPLNPMYYDDALDCINSTHWQPGDRLYMYDIQLLEAAIHARMRDVESDEDIKKQHESCRKIAKSNFQEACIRYRPWTKERPWGRKDEKRWHTFVKEVDEKHWLEGVDLALE